MSIKLSVNYKTSKISNLFNRMYQMINLTYIAHKKRITNGKNAPNVIATDCKFIDSPEI